MKLVRLSILLLFLSLAVTAYPAEHFFKCSTAKQLMLQTFKDGYAYVATSIEKHDFVVQFYLDLKNMRFRLIGVDDNQNACILIEGYSWTPIVEHDI